MLGKIEGRRRRRWQRMRWLDSTTDSMDMNWSKLWETVEDRGAWRACCSHWVTKSWTRLNDWTANNRPLQITQFLWFRFSLRQLIFLGIDHCLSFCLLVLCIPRDQTLVTCISCTGLCILYLCTTWEACLLFFFFPQILQDLGNERSFPHFQSIRQLINSLSVPGVTPRALPLSASSP